MVANTPDQVRVDERDDMQHIQTQRLLALRVIAPPKSKFGQLLEKLLAQLYDEVGEQGTLAKRQGRAFDGASGQDRTAANSDGASDGTAILGAPTSDNSIQQSTLELGNTNLTQGADLAARGQSQSADLQNSADQVGAERRTPATNAPQLQRSRFRQSKSTELAQSSQVNWIWMLSQLLKTDLKRLGLEPDEFDDIRVFLIKNEARKFDKLELLSHLPDSLSPQAVTKIFEDIRTMAAGYVAFVLVGRAKSDLENGEELKQIPEVPRSISGALYGIPLIDFDPEEALKKLG